jgi:hypothetical protein
MEQELQQQECISDTGKVLAATTELCPGDTEAANQLDAELRKELRSQEYVRSYISVMGLPSIEMCAAASSILVPIVWAICGGRTSINPLLGMKFLGFFGAFPPGRARQVLRGVTTFDVCIQKLVEPQRFNALVRIACEDSPEAFTARVCIDSYLQSIDFTPSIQADPQALLLLAQTCLNSDSNHLCGYGPYSKRPILNSDIAGKILPILAASVIPETASGVRDLISHAAARTAKWKGARGRSLSQMCQSASSILAVRLSQFDEDTLQRTARGADLVDARARLDGHFASQRRYANAFNALNLVSTTALIGTGLFHFLFHTPAHADLQLILFAANWWIWYALSLFKARISPKQEELFALQSIVEDGRFLPEWVKLMNHPDNSTSSAAKQQVLHILESADISTFSPGQLDSLIDFLMAIPDSSLYEHFCFSPESGSNRTNADFIEAVVNVTPPVLTASVLKRLLLRVQRISNAPSTEHATQAELKLKRTCAESIPQITGLIEKRLETESLLRASSINAPTPSELVRPVLQAAEEGELLRAAIQDSDR